MIHSSRPWFLNWLAHPTHHSEELDTPETTNQRREIIRLKPFLKRLYQEWYESILAAFPPDETPLLELGSGAGFIKEISPRVILSDVLTIDQVDLVLDGLAIPFQSGVLGGMVMTNVLHHIPDPQRFFQEAARCISSGGRIVMIEPWLTPWSRLIYKNHGEPYDPAQKGWRFITSGPLTGSNIASPWIMFSRDRALWEHQLPEWHIESIELMMPFLYLLSGGVSFNASMPAWSFRFWKNFEKMLRPFLPALAMFARIVLVHR